MYVLFYEIEKRDTERRRSHLILEYNSLKT